MTPSPGLRPRPAMTTLEPEWDRMTLDYQISLFLVALLLILLPFCYFALVGGALGGMIEMIRHHEAWSKSFSGMVIRWLTEKPLGPTAGFETVKSWTLLAYDVAIFLLGGLVFFMIKPVFRPRPPGVGGGLFLRRDRQPRLWDLVEDVSRATGAPMPEMIMVSSDVNASATSIVPWWNPFGEERLILTIGLPLLMVLNKRELAGVIAHELGHFSQHTGSLLGGMIFRVLDWFKRVIRHRDQWDDKILAASMAEDGGFWHWVVGLLETLVFLSRCLLRLLHLIGEAGSCFLMRRRELDADRFEIRLVGSEVFEDTLRKLQVMAEAESRTMKELIEGIREDRGLPDDLTGLFARKYAEISPDMAVSIFHKSLNNTPDLLASHPPDQQRVEQAKSMNEPGIYKEIALARELVSDLQDISIAATHSFYQWTGLFRIPQVKLRFLDPPGDPFSDDKALFAAAERIFHGNFLTLFNQPLPPVNLERTFDPELLYRDLLRFGKARRKRRQTVSTTSRAGSAPTRYMDERQAAWMDQLGTLQEEYLFNPSARPHAITKIRELNQLLEKIAEEMRPYEEETKSRVLATLCLLGFWDVSLRMARCGFTSERFRVNCLTLYSLAEHAVTIREALARNHLLGKTAEKVNLRAAPETWGDELLPLLFSAQHDALKKLQESLHGRECFSPKEKVMVDLGNHLIRKLPELGDSAGILKASQTLDERFLQMYCRVLGEIALFVEQTERLVGVPPDSEPL